MVILDRVLEVSISSQDWKVKSFFTPHNLNLSATVQRQPFRAAKILLHTFFRFMRYSFLYGKQKTIVFNRTSTIPEFFCSPEWRIQYFFKKKTTLPDFVQVATTKVSLQSVEVPWRKWGHFRLFLVFVVPMFYIRVWGCELEYSRTFNVLCNVSLLWKF